MAGPELPPFSKDVRVRTSSRPCGEDPLWHFAQFASSIGRTSFSNWMPAPAVHGSRHNPLDTRNHFDILQANFDRTRMILRCCHYTTPYGTVPCVFYVRISRITQLHRVVGRTDRWSVLDFLCFPLG